MYRLFNKINKLLKRRVRIGVGNNSPINNRFIPKIVDIKVGDEERGRGTRGSQGNLENYQGK